jgi:predicted molibdopterin-dependent oxidoreductase YjgC
MHRDQADQCTISVLVDGRPENVAAGRTVAATLIALGATSWRRTRLADRPRGVFCGIGSCFDCLVTVNDVPAVRACLAWIEDGDDIRTDEGRQG